MLGLCALRAEAWEWGRALTGYEIGTVAKTVTNIGLSKGQRLKLGLILGLKMGLGAKTGAEDGLKLDLEAAFKVQDTTCPHVT